MFKSTFLHFVFIFLHTIHSQRKILDGDTVYAKKRYVVYLVKALSAQSPDETWLCGGAIVTSLFILTSSACLESVDYIFAISGLSEYVRTEDLRTHPCTRKTRKRIVMTCVPKSYDFDENIEYWSNIDIALAKVESEFDFNSAPPECSYPPNFIDINFDPKYQNPGIDVQVYGWGHNLTWKPPEDKSDLNVKYLQYAPLIIRQRSVCHKAYANLNLTKIIDNNMLCVDAPGNIDDQGNIIHRANPVEEQCVTEIEKQRGIKGVLCKNNSFSDNTRRYATTDGKVLRGKGICQNDHGGPLVTFIGNREYLIGVASLYRVTASSRCVGPFLFTSTQCNGLFLSCVLNETVLQDVNSVCNIKSYARGFEIRKKIISWRNHPEGPAANEIDDWEASTAAPLRFRPEDMSSSSSRELFSD